MIRDRIVVGIHDDATRHKLLQVRDLTLAKAIDICKASEAARKQMKAMSADVQALNQAKRSTARARGREMSRGRGTRDNSNTRNCKYCDRKHEQRKEACPAYGKVCRKCSKKHHFEIVCKSKSSVKKTARHDVHEIEADDDDDAEELLTLGDADADRWYTRLKINGKIVRFLLDCGATVNLIPEALIRSLGRQNDVRPATATLRMFDKSKLQTSGMITIPVEHPRTSKVYNLEFFVAAKHEQALLGFNTCRALKLLRVVEENICKLRLLKRHRLNNRNDRRNSRRRLLKPNA